MKFRSLSLAAIVATLSVQTYAGAPTFLDSRSLAMGGVGVAAARPAAASFFNPALLAIQQKSKADSFGLIIPSFYVIATDEDELRDEIDDFEEDILDPFEAALSTMEAASFSSVQEAQDAGNDLIAAAQTMEAKLAELNSDQALVDVGLGFSVQIPNEKFGFGVFTSANARASGTIEYRDAALITGYITDVETVLAGGNVVTDLENLDLTYNDGELQSDVRAVGIANSQVGVSLARTFEISGRRVAIGVSPKIVNLRAFDLIADVDDFEADNLEDSEVSDTSFNLDVGAATYVDEQRQWLVGVSIINLLSQELKTEGGTIAGNNVNPGNQSIEGLTIELKPMITAGVSYSGLNYLVAADLELTKSDAIFQEDDRQFIGLGAEYDLAETAQFRAGIRHNLSGSTDPILSVGLGLTVVGASMEIAALGNSNSLGLSLQFGSTF